MVIRFRICTQSVGNDFLYFFVFFLIGYRMMSRLRQLGGLFSLVSREDGCMMHEKKETSSVRMQRS